MHTQIDNITKVSVILTTFNRQNEVKFAVESVINQDFTKWELLVIDDGSDDETFYIIRDFILKGHNIKYFYHQNRGPALSRNIGILASTGKYITFLDSDDKYSHDHIQKRYDYLENNVEIDLLHGGVKIIGDEYVKDKNDFKKKIHIKDCVVGATFFGKTAIFKESDGFKDIKYSAESEYYERLDKKYKTQKVTWPTYIYNRMGDNSITKNI